MQCPRCGSTNVNVQLVTETKMVDQHHGVVWWIFVGWWWIFIKWLVFTLPALIIALFKPKRRQLKQQHVSRCVCQNCGNTWSV